MKNLLFIIFYLFLNVINRITRHLYWLYRLWKCNIGKEVKIVYPIKVEGSGKFIFGDNVKISRKVDLGAGAKSIITFGKNTIIQEGFYLRANKGVSITFGANCNLGPGVKIYTNSNWCVGEGVTISSNCALHAREPGLNGVFIIGDHSYIGDNTIIDLTDKVEIGNDIAIGPNCTLYTHDHDYKNTKEKPAWQGQLKTSPIKIEDGAWIGSNVTLLPGVSIGKNAVVASGAVVTRSVKEYTTVAGVPARNIKSADE